MGVSATAGTVRRSDHVTCTASALAGIRHIKSWKFVSLDSSLKTNRQETDPDSTHFSNVWAGQMVASGIVTVQAKVGKDSVLQSANASVFVSPRDWVHASDPSYMPVPAWPALPRYVHQGNLPVVPENVHDLGKTVWAFLSDNVVDSTGHQGTIVTGPNSPVFYVAAMPPVLDSLIIEINETALTMQSSFWNIQPALNPNKTYNRTPCFQDDVTSTAALTSIQMHEGTRWDARRRRSSSEQVGFSGISGDEENPSICARHGG